MKTRGRAGLAAGLASALLLTIAVCAAVALASVAGAPSLPALSAPAPTVTKTSYGATTSGAAIDQYALTNSHGLTVKLITYGAIITSIDNPAENMPDVVLGFSNLRDYETKNSPHFGGIIGRYANRIANGVFSLDGVTYCLDPNNGPNTLHSGFVGFDKEVWTAAGVIQNAKEAGVELHYLSKAGEGWTGATPNPNCPSNAVKGFPGNLDTHVTYTLDNDGRLTIRYHATTDAPTVINLTNHTYWNLSGEGTGTIYRHIVTLNADSFTPVNSGLIPDGSTRSVEGTVFDFRKGKAVEDGIRTPDPQLVFAGGYDHNWIVNAPQGKEKLAWAATVYDPDSRRTLRIFTDQPGIQLYAGNSLDGKVYGASGRQYRQSDGVALETEHFPDSPNQPSFPSTVLRPGQTFESTTVIELPEK
ncbi:MAG TPA: galactose-1-epimerase [Candidatus Micrarchaeaceae archaeon]|nr:galactose-1-epimerase [Candidatus Micrarchaeaceae archaeon]